MRMRRSLPVRGLVVFLALLSSAWLACVGGHIPPSTFQFENVVPYTPPGEGGWKAAQVLVLLSKISSSFPQSATCDIEVGVPERNLNGWVTDEDAQVAAAEAADRAARIVLRQRLMTAVACKQFREHMQRLMQSSEVSKPIPGARVSGFKGVLVSRKTFP
ncbi:hypothetical protein [Archangium violaceum]|uniref:Lipoprotein n=1 Tax=Archangium violaceum Cb vi76 TaxID=1406225 RepID=A0A084SZ75_9BACT|nr:hypothetical protein [Archangium violaceum]KFA93760.1 hypothetical protein Q664_07090 [Archangium violaceum Cb vi76]